MPAASSRSSRLLLPLLAVLGLGGAVYWFFVMPWQEYDRQAADLRQKIDDKFIQLRMIAKEQKAVQDMQARGLPANPYVARREYDRYLANLLASSGLAVEFQRGSSPTPQDAAGQFKMGKKKEPVYTPLTFQVRARGSMPQLAKLLDRFHTTPLAHKVKSLTVEPAGGKDAKPGEALNVGLTIEALIVHGGNRPEALTGVDDQLVQINALLGPRAAGLALLPYILGPTGPLAEQRLAAERPQRDYAALALKNVFAGGQPKPAPPAPPVTEGPPPDPGPDMTQYVHLILIEQTDKVAKALLRNRFTNDPVWMQARRGLNSFMVYDESGENVTLRGKVLGVRQREVFFLVDGQLHAIHMGQSLAEALDRPAGWGDLEKTGMDAEFLRLYLGSLQTGL